MGERASGEIYSGTPLFLHSTHHADALSAAVADSGWRAICERRAGHAESSFLASGANVALVDARGDFDGGLQALVSLADATEVNAAALLVLVDADELGRLDLLVDAGATHYLAEPFSEAELRQSLRLAERHATRLSGSASRAVHASAPALGRDALTGLGDAATARRWVEARLVGQRPVHLLLLAITRFEMINTAFGREIGDDILSRVSRIVVPLVGELGGAQSLVARTAGAEFIIGIEGFAGDDRLKLLAEQIVDQVERPMMSGAHLVTLSSRIVVIPADDERDASQLLRRASAMLADARAGETSHIRMMKAGPLDPALDAEALKADLRAALDRGEIEMLFQPQVSIASGKITGVEALARWHHARLGELGAATLFAAAEQSDYLAPLSAHIQQAALAIASRWPEALSALRLAINITAGDIARPGFADTFLKLVDDSGFPRGRLTVEITESGLIEDLGAAADLLAKLRAGGCRVAIDDFGTGYSSLAYLKSLPLDYLKIDSKLAQDICGTPRDRIVVRGVIDMARSLGLAVIAEGVETEEQLQLLAREGCNYYQGFLCAGALDTNALTALVGGQALANG